MKLGQLAFGCYVFKSMSDDDVDYRDLLTATGGSLDLSRDDHCQHLLVFLTRWGCQQFLNPAQHGIARLSMSTWYSEIRSVLVPPTAELLSLTDKNLRVMDAAYHLLAQKTACKRIVRGKEINVTFGPTGAAKTLFALRPKAMMPWDDPVRAHFGYDGSGRSYCQFLQAVQGWLTDLDADCRKHGIDLLLLPKTLNEPHASLVKLVDEYLWVTISQRCTVPHKSEFERWVEWS